MLWKLLYFIMLSAIWRSYYLGFHLKLTSCSKLIHFKRILLLSLSKSIFCISSIHIWTNFIFMHRSLYCAIILLKRLLKHFFTLCKVDNWMFTNHFSCILFMLIVFIPTLLELVVQGSWNYLHCWNKALEVLMCLKLYWIRNYLNLIF